MADPIVVGDRNSSSHDHANFDVRFKASAMSERSNNFRERIIAVHKPLLYAEVFTLRLKFFYIFCGLLFLGGSITWAALSAFGDPRMTSTQHCSIVSSTSKAYSTFHFAFVPSAYLCSFLSLFFITVLLNVSPFRTRTPYLHYHFD